MEEQQQQKGTEMKEKKKEKSGRHFTSALHKRPRRRGVSAFFFLRVFFIRFLFSFLPTFSVDFILSPAATKSGRPCLFYDYSRPLDQRPLSPSSRPFRCDRPFSRFASDFIGLFPSGSSGFTRLYRVLTGFTGFYRVLPGLSWVSMCLTRFSIGFTRFFLGFR